MFLSCLTIGLPAYGQTPISHHNFDEGNGSSASDSSGNGHTGSLQGSPSWIAGQVNAALSFNGASQYVRVPNSADFNITGDITIAAWIKRDTVNDYGAILAKASNSFWDYDFFFGGVDNRLNFYSDATSPSFVSSSASLSDTTGWHHVAVTRSGSTVTFYIDGAPAGTATMSGAFGANDVPVEIGRDAPHSGGLGHFSGSIDDVRLYDVALTAGEIDSLFQAGTGAPPTLVFDATPSVVQPGGTATLTWLGQNVQTCTATGDWDGPKLPQGAEPVVGITTDLSFTLTCTGVGGSVTDTTTVSVDTPPPVDTEAPTTPSGLTVVNVTASSVLLSWNASSDNVGVAGYNVYADGNWIATSTGTSFNDTGLLPDTSYTYEVSAFDEAGNESGLSAPVVATTPPPPVSGFPSTPLLDDFNRPDEGPPPSADWVNSLSDQFPGHMGIMVQDNKAVGPNLDDSHSSVWNEVFHQDQEVYYEFADVPGTSAAMGPALRKKSPTDLQSDQYIAFYSQKTIGQNASEVALWKRLNGVWTRLGLTTVNQDLVAGDQMGMRAEGNLITVYLNGIEVISHTDNNNPILGPGYTQLYVGDDFGHVADNFGGGSIDPSLPFCGDFNTDPVETCDDGNIASGDGCSASCQLEGGVPGIGLVGYWPFDLASIAGQVAMDASGNGNDGVLTGGPATANPGALNEGLQFDDTDDHVSVPHDPSLDIVNDLTIAAWVKRGQLANYSPIVAKQGGSNWDYDFFFGGADNKLSFYADGTSPGFVQSAGSIVDTLGWHHVAVTRSGGTVTFYIDGIQSGQSTMTGSFNANALPLSIGTDGDHSGGIGFFSGGLDEVRLYDRALTATEIDALYQAGL